MADGFPRLLVSLDLLRPVFVLANIMLVYHPFIQSMLLFVCHWLSFIQPAVWKFSDFFTRLSGVSAVFLYFLISVPWYYPFSLELPRFTNALSMVFPEYLNETCKQSFVHYCNNMMKANKLLLKLLGITFKDSNGFNLRFFKLYYKLII